MIKKWPSSYASGIPSFPFPLQISSAEVEKTWKGKVTNEMNAWK